MTDAKQTSRQSPLAPAGIEPHKMRRVERVALGDVVALHAPASGVLVTLNASAALIWSILEVDATPHETAEQLVTSFGLAPSVARRDVETSIETWIKAGLFEDAAPPNVVSIWDGTNLSFASERYYSGAGGVVCLRCEDPNAALIMDAVLSPLQTTGHDDLHNVDMTGAGENHCVHVEGKTVFGPGNIAYARHFALREIIMGRDLAKTTVALLHASSVAVGDRAILLAGNTGVGKTTLTAALLHHGADYVGDDLLALQPDGISVRPFPVKLSVKSGSWPIVSNMYPTFDALPTIEINKHKMRYFDVTAGNCRRDQIEVAAIILPHFSAGSNLTIDKLTPDAALAGLIASNTRLTGDAPTLRPLIKLVTSVPTMSLTYGSLADAVPAVLNFAKTEQC